MSTIRCPQCNLINFATAVACRRCGYFFQTPTAAAAGEAAAVNPAAAQSFFAVGGGQQAFSEARKSSRTNEAAAGYTPQPQLPPPRSNYYESQQYHQAYQTKPKQKNGLAITSMVMGIIGFSLMCLGGFMIAPVGLILGIVAIVKANRRPAEYGGKGFAIAGVVSCGLLSVCLPVILAIAIPNLLAARRAVNESIAVATLLQLADAEHRYMSSMSGKCGDIQTLIAGKLLPDVSLAKNEKSGYRFAVVNLPAGGCEITATPLTTSHGKRSFFYSTEDNVFRGADKKGLAADKNDLPLEGNFPGDEMEESLWGQPPSESAALSELRTLH
ncbi:MAG: DUF4190 domain-containing protein, partial [Acidobacteriota bacterium]|nr:DUF4190 domain-containing protein [Acidobacteriota bacterium]